MRVSLPELPNDCQKQIISTARQRCLEYTRLRYALVYVPLLCSYPVPDMLKLHLNTIRYISSKRSFGTSPIGAISSVRWRIALLPSSIALSLSLPDFRSQGREGPFAADAS